MSREIVCPHCGASVQVDASAMIALEPSTPEGSPSQSPACPHPTSSESPTEPGPASESSAALPSDDPHAVESSPEPEAEVPTLPPGEVSPAIGGLDWLRSSGSGEAVSGNVEPPAPESEAIADEGKPVAAQASPTVDPFLEAFTHNDPTSGADAPRQGISALPGLNVSEPMAAPPESNGHSRSRSGELPALEEREEAGRSSLSMTLLSSYASAVTLALIWMLWRAEPPVAPVAPTLPASSRSDLEDGGDRAFVARLPPIPPVRSTTIGQSLRVGDLEITPLTIRLGSVRLISTTNRGREQEGGNEALHLRIRLRNLSDSKEFSPLHPSSVREPDRGVPKSLIVADDRLILPYRLATHSEWEISDQSFLKLAPGAEFETVIVSEDSAREKLANSMIWRLHVQTSLDQTELLGIRFNSDEIEVE